MSKGRPSNWLCLPNLPLKITPIAIVERARIVAEENNLRNGTIGPAAMIGCVAYRTLNRLPYGWLAALRSCRLNDPVQRSGAKMMLAHRSALSRSS
jgi:hypothetical protein